MSRRMQVLIPVLMIPAFAGCSVELVGTGIAGDRQGTVRASNIEAVIDQTGVCEADLSLDPTALRARQKSTSLGKSTPLGMTECEFVAARGQPASVEINEETGARQVVLTYARGKLRQIYRFTNNRLVSSG